MKPLLIALCLLGAAACSPIPELVGVFQVSDTDGGVDLGSQEQFPPRPDLASPPGSSPCPKTFGTSASFCYWSQGQGELNLSTALALVGMDPSCTLMAGRLSANAAALTCSAEFAQSIVMGWGLSMTKPINLAFSYSIKQPIDRATLTVNMPSGSTNAVLLVNGISGSQNVISLYSPMGTMFAPGFSITLAGAAKRGTLTFDWISVSQ
jgi:hypothetical protein